MWNIEDARTGFDRMPKRDIISWTAMLSGCVQQGHYEEALQLSYQMRQAGMEPELLFFASALRACDSLAALEHGRQIHDLIVRTGSEFDVAVGSSLVDMGTLMMHAKCLIICQAEILPTGLR
jgi:pentatricopeptide repeat protein